MITNFKDEETRKIFLGVTSTKIPQTIQKVANRKLTAIDAAKCIDDLRFPPGNHLEALKGDKIGQYSIRINDQWRICFVPIDSWTNFMDVYITDYH